MFILIFLLTGLNFSTSQTTFAPEFLGGPDATVPAEVGLAALERRIGTPLPRSTEVLGFIDGGFQDRFWQIKLRVSDRELAALLAAFSAQSFQPTNTFYFAQPNVGFWNPGMMPDQQTAQGVIPGFDTSQLLTAPDPDGAGFTLIYIFSFQN